MYGAIVFQEYKDSALYAVFDGHAGPEASYYTAAHFLFNLLSQTSKDKCQALVSAFSKTDQDFVVKAQRDVGLSKAFMITTFETSGDH